MLSNLLVLLTLSSTFAMEQTISGGDSQEEAPELVPKAEWARSPHDEPGTLVDGRVITKADGPAIEDDATGGQTGGETGATGGELGATGIADEATGGATGASTGASDRIVMTKEDCEDCGKSQDKIDDDGGNKRPIIDEAHAVIHHTYNMTGDYEGQGTLADPGEGASGEKCCRVCPPASECKNKDECFHKCKKVCGPTCSIPSPPALCDPKDKGCNGDTKPVPITPEMVQAVADTPVEGKVAKIQALLRGAKGETSKAVAPKKEGAVVVEDAVGTQ